jgi:aminoglycoside phosphotransferase (APT) family kinase protein
MSRAESTSPLAPDGDTRLKAGLVRWLASQRGYNDVSLTEVTRPAGGYSSETIFVEVDWDHEGRRIGSSLVLRMAPQEPGSFADYDLVPQFEAQIAAAAAGVPVADPVLEGDPAWLGAPFILMPRVDGRVIGQLPQLDPWVATLTLPERRLVYDEFLSTLAVIHRADTATIPHVPRRDNGVELDYWAEYLSWSCEGHPIPILVDALAWCRSHRPAGEPPEALLWGDVRFENCVVGDDLHPRAVLDWDMASVGAPEHDLAWFTSLQFTMQHLVGQWVDGFPDRSGAVTRFEELSGRSMMDLEWYETLAMTRSTAIMTRINFLRQKAGRRVLLPLEENPILDLLAARLS